MMRKILIVLGLGIIVIVVSIIYFKPTFESSNYQLYGKSENFEANYETSGWSIWYYYNNRLKYIHNGNTNFVVDYIGTKKEISNDVELKYEYETGPSGGSGNINRFNGGRIVNSSSNDYQALLKGEYYINITLDGNDESIVLEEVSK